MHPQITAMALNMQIRSILIHFPTLHIIFMCIICIVFCVSLKRENAFGTISVCGIDRRVFMLMVKSSWTSFVSVHIFQKQATCHLHSQDIYIKLSTHFNGMIKMGFFSSAAGVKLIVIKTLAMTLSHNVINHVIDWTRYYLHETWRFILSGGYPKYQFPDL